MKPKAAILAPLGWCVRDWVLSDFLPALTSGAEVTVFSSQAEALREGLRLPDVSFEYMEVRPLPPIPQNLVTALYFSHLCKQQTYVSKSVLSDLRNGWPWRSRLRLRVLKGVARHLLKRFPEEWTLRTEQAFLGLMAESRRIENVLQSRNIRMVYSTMPLIAHYDRPALWAAQRLGIPTACMITSWDNLFSKGRRPIAFSHYLVWSERMRDDLLAQYADIVPETISVIGAPQFDVYRRRDMIKDRGEFIRSIGGDPARRLILWSGASINQMPNEPRVLALFCEASRSGKLLDNPQILVRPHPIGGGARFSEVRKSYPELLFTETNAADPTFLIGWVPHLEDASLLVNSIAHCDVNINHCSTMTLDCCAMDRPVINLAFDLEKGSAMEQYVQNCYKYDHYTSVTDCRAVRLVESLEALVEHTNLYLKNPTLDREGRMRLLRLQCGELDGRATARAAECLLKLMSKDGMNGR